MMVRFRGINVNVVSQLDAQRLPEYSTARSLDALGRVAACFVPVRPGAQIWLEYALDGPHPDKAAYFFKLLVDGQNVISWDCTEEHEYCGKTVFLLHTAESHPSSGLKTVLQRSIAFTSTHGPKSPKIAGDCLEVRVHRIEHRRRVRDLPVDQVILKSLRGQGALRIAEHGAIEPRRPARKYQYQLLDPRDEPYATFRFYCRTQEYLQRHNILDVDRSSVTTSVTTPTSSYLDAQSSPDPPEKLELDHTPHTPTTPTKSSDYKCSAKKSSNTNKATTKSPSKFRSPRREVVKLKGSIEDLPTTVPRSLQSIKSPRFQPSLENIPASPTRQSSPLLPEALNILRIPKRRSPNKCFNTNKSTSSTFTTRTSSAKPLPPPKFNITNTTQPSTNSPMPKHLDFQRRKASHLKLDLDGSSTLSSDPFLETRDTTHRSLSPFTPGGLLRKISSASILRSQRSVTPLVIVPSVSEVNEAMRRKSDEIYGGRGAIGDNGIEATADNRSMSTPQRLKQKCNLWAAGRSGWTRRQKVEGGS